MATSRPIGYEFLASQLESQAFPIERPARIGPVTRVTAQADALLVSASVAPDNDDPLQHLFFAHKHEGMYVFTGYASSRRVSGTTPCSET